MADEPTLTEQVAALEAKINAKFKGKGRLKRAVDIVLPYYMLRRPSGIVDLDIATGGGLPAGGLVEIIGPEGSCKTYLLILYMLQQQRIFEDSCVLGACQTEIHFDKLFAKIRGLRISYSDDEIGRMEELEGRVFDEDELASMRDQIGHFQEAFAESAETLYDILLAMLRSRLYNIVGIDSWGAMLTIEETKKTMHDKTRGGAPKVNAEWIRRFSALMGLEDEQGRANMTTVIGINQMRDSMGSRGFNIQGGWAIKHGKLVSIKLTPGPHIYREAKGGIKVGADDSTSKLPKIGKVIRWQIIKGKAGCHDGPTGEFYYYFDSGADLERALVVTAQKCGVMTTSGSWLSFGKKKKQGVGKWAAALKKDRALHDKLFDAVMDAHGIKPNYR